MSKNVTLVPFCKTECFDYILVSLLEFYEPYEKRCTATNSLGKPLMSLSALKCKVTSKGSKVKSSNLYAS